MPTIPPEIVIVVDDDPALLHALRFVFEVEGFSVRAFPDAESLLAEPGLPSHGCLVVDYKLPGIDGLELLQTLRSRGVKLPAVLITTPTPLVTQRAEAAEVPIVGKPLVANALLDEVNALLHHPAG